MTATAAPCPTAASPLVAPSPNSNAAGTSSTSKNNGDDDEEEEAPSIASYYCCAYFESEKAGLKDLCVLFAMAERHYYRLLKHTDPAPFIESKIYAKQRNQTGRFCKLSVNAD
mgnify:CR=1 FL=1